jgi:hypothetical protein
VPLGENHLGRLRREKGEEYTRRVKTAERMG